MIVGLLHLIYTRPFHSAGYSVAGGEFSGDDVEGEGFIYSTESQSAWLSRVLRLALPHLCLILSCSSPHAGCIETEWDD